MHKGIVEIDGNYWPETDKECHTAVMVQHKDMHEAIELCKKREVVVQASGNCGIWPRDLAKIFNMVYTFEPDITNFLCLNLNVPDKNVVRMQAALGNARSPIGMDLKKENVGAHQVKQHGLIPQIKIDDLCLPACDLIQLDVEGYEYFAIKPLKASCHNAPTSCPVIHRSPFLRAVLSTLTISYVWLSQTNCHFVVISDL